MQGKGNLGIEVRNDASRVGMAMLAVPGCYLRRRTNATAVHMSTYDFC